jgi:hypothetical protein
MTLAIIFLFLPILLGLARVMLYFFECDPRVIFIRPAMKQKREKRIKKKLLVHIGENGFEQMGVTANISSHGMCIATTEIFPAKSKLSIWIAAADDIFAVTGMVVWSMKKKMAPGENIPVGLGIKIKEATPGYVHYIKTISNNTPLPHGN